MDNPYSRPGLYNADCMEAMKHFPDGFFDLAVVDPPYGIGADRFNNGAGAKDHGGNSTAKRLRVNDGRGKLRDRRLNQSDCSWDSQPPSKEYFDELRRVSKHQIIWGGNYFQLPPTRGMIVWDKEQPWENFSQVELAWTSFDKPASLFRYSNTTSANKDHLNKIHPTQKPTALYEWVLRKYAKPGDKILDTHAGSASSLVACYRHGFDAWGFEIDKGYYNAARKRLADEMAQMTIWTEQNDMINTWEV